MGRKIFSFRHVATIFLTLAILILGGLNAQQKRRYVPPDDGCTWTAVSDTVQARQVVIDGPSDKAGIERGDILKAINGRPIQNDRDVTKVLYELGVWSKATYTLDRAGTIFETTVIVTPPPSRVLRQQEY